MEENYRKEETGPLKKNLKRAGRIDIIEMVCYLLEILWLLWPFSQRRLCSIIGLSIAKMWSKSVE